MTAIIGIRFRKENAKNRNGLILKIRPFSGSNSGCRNKIRTYDPLINSQLLYR